jgi:hypothetical protein
LGDISSFLIDDLDKEICFLNFDCPEEAHLMLPNNSPFKTLSGLRIEGVVTREGGEASEVLHRYLIDPFDELKPLAVDHYAIGVLDIDALE